MDVIPSGSAVQHYGPNISGGAADAVERDGLYMVLHVGDDLGVTFATTSATSTILVYGALLPAP